MIFALKYDGLFPFVTVNSLFILFVIFLRFYSISVACFLYFNNTHVTHKTHSSEILAGNVQIYQKTCTQAILIVVAGAIVAAYISNSGRNVEGAIFCQLN